MIDKDIETLNGIIKTKDNKISLLNARILEQQKEIDNLKKTKIIEYQHIVSEKKIIRHGNKRKQRTYKTKRNPNKIVLDNIDDIQLFIYVNDDNQKLMIGWGDRYKIIDKYEYPRLFKWYRLGKWVYDENGIKKAINGTSKSEYAKRIRKAYIKFLEGVFKNEED